jgi:hypothetical protein
MWQKTSLTCAYTSTHNLEFMCLDKKIKNDYYSLKHIKLFPKAFNITKIWKQ